MMVIASGSFPCQTAYTEELPDTDVSGVYEVMIGTDAGDGLIRYFAEFGFKPEAKDAVIDGDWQAGPKAVFGMTPGASHWYRGFVSPNNICGKLKFFVPRVPRPDRSEYQRPGQLGITLHSVYTSKLEMIHDLSYRHGLTATDVMKNEFDEDSFLMSGPDGATWQVIARPGSESPPVTEFELVPVNN